MDRHIRSKKDKWKMVLVEVILFLMAAIIMIPLLLLFLTTFKEASQIHNPFSQPDFTNLYNYLRAFERVNVPLAFFNSLVITVATIAINILISSLAGYAISRSKDRFVPKLYFYFVMGMIIPFQASMVVTYKLGASMHLLDTRLFLILQYVAGGCAYAIMIYTGFMKAIPKDLDEAASIDGSGLFHTFFSIIFPLLKPASLTLASITCFWYWNDFAGPLIYLNGKGKETIQYSLFLFQNDQRSVELGPIYALTFIAIFPMLIFFFFAQKYLVGGLVAGAVKG
jgi:raffinose/stachyose/melibiose transport system permease protein